MPSRSKSAVSTAFILFLAAGCEKATPDPVPDLWKVLDRTVRTMETFHGALQSDDVHVIGDTHMIDFTDRLHGSLNAPPRFYDSAIGITLLADASFEGFRDLDADAVWDADENRIFTIEIDPVNSRLIATDISGKSTAYRLSSGGFFAGTFVKGLIDRQRMAGVKPDAFDNREVASRSGPWPSHQDGSSDENQAEQSSGDDEMRE